jgi:single-strand DNA-binding protein
MNNGNIIGRLVRDIELKYSKDNKPIAKGSIAVDDKYKKDKTHFFNLTAFGKTAETMSKYLKKGSQIGVEYSLDHNTWKSESGENKSSVGLIVNGFTFCGSKDSLQSGKTEQGQQGNDEVPF